MKKIGKYFLVILFVIMLLGCDSTTKNNQIDENDVVEYYIPSGVEFKLYKGFGNENQIDVSEYFDVSFNCEGHTVWDDCFAANIGTSIESGGLSVGAGTNTINGVEYPNANTITYDLTFYALSGEDLSIYSTFLLESETGDIKRENQTGTDFVSGVKLYGTIMGEKEDGTKYIVEYTFNYVTIDELVQVTIKQFDQNDNLLLETVIPKNDLLESITLNEDTEYYFVIEDYVDEEGETYQERIYKDTSSIFSYLYKYTNEDGFLNGDRLIIE